MSTVKLNWDTASAQMLTSVKEIWADEGFANVTLAFEDESVIHTNRTLLAAISPVMRSFLKDKNTRNSKILMFGMESSIVTALLDFIFREEIFLEQDKLDLFFSTASKLKINGFMEGKAEDSKLNPIGFTKGKEEDKNQQNDDSSENELSRILQRRQSLDEARARGEKVEPVQKSVRSRNVYVEFQEWTRKEIKDFEKKFKV